MATIPLPSRRSRLAVATIFFVNGAVLASWVAHIPGVKERHGIGDGSLGFVLLFMALGAVLALPLGGWLVDRFGSRLITSLAALVFCLALPWPLLSRDVTCLVTALVLLGACNAVLDVSMNAQAVAVERRYQRSIMSSFHALWSLGGVVGAALSGLAMSLDALPARYLVATAIVAAAFVSGTLGWLVPSEPRRDGVAHIVGPPSRRLLGLGLVAFLGLLAEGAMGDWSAVYLHDALGQSGAAAATGFAAFSLAMAVGRLGGDRLADGLGPRALLRASGAVAAAGLGVALIAGEPRVALAGFAAVGLGIANIIPVTFRSAGRVSDVPAGTALAAVATTGYLGYLAGPPLIGLVAETTSLPLGLGIVSACCALVAVRAGSVPRDPSSGRSGGRR